MEFFFEETVFGAQGIECEKVLKRYSGDARDRFEEVNVIFAQVARVGRADEVEDAEDLLDRDQRDAEGFCCASRFVGDVSRDGGALPDRAVDEFSLDIDGLSGAALAVVGADR